MGLDITAYKNLSVVKSGLVKSDDDAYYELQDEYFIPYDNTDFTGRSAGLDPNTAYDAEEEFRFRAGSYGGYGNFRNTLARIAGYPETEYDRYESKALSYAAGAWAASSGPFYELINFSDCEGTIGPVVAKKLAGDFAEFQPVVDEMLDRIGDAWTAKNFKDSYANWRKAFEMASDNGAVSFH